MTPSAIVSAALGAVRMGLLFIPSAPRVLVAILDELDVLPGLIAELGDGTWTDEDVAALDEALTGLLENVPDLDARTCRRIARGVSSLVDVIVSQSRKQPIAGKRGERARDIVDRARRRAVAQRLPDVASR